LRWLILTDDFPPCPGGVATWTEALAGGLAQRGVDVLVLARRRGERRSGGSPYRVVGVRGRSFSRWGGVWIGAAVLPRLRRGDHVLATTWPAAHGPHRWYGRRGPFHVVAHGSDVTMDPARRLGAKVFQVATHRWATSSYLAGQLRGTGHVGVLPAPIDLLPHATACGGSLSQWGWVGRATRWKGGDRFLRLLKASVATAVMVGDGPELCRWRELAAELGLSHRVRFTGQVPRDQVIRALRGCQAVFLLSRAHPNGGGAEGLGLSLIEAAAAGRGPGGSRGGGIPEAVGPGILLDDPDDPVRSLAQLHRSWHPRLGARCRRWVAKNHGVQRMVDVVLGADLPGR